MPKSRSAVTRVSQIFDQFVSSLSTTIREKVSEAVSKATAEFFSAKIGAPIAETTETPPRRKYRRRRAKKIKAVAAPAPTKPDRAKRGPASGKKTVRLSKNGKRIGRPPKQTAVPAVKEKPVKKPAPSPAPIAKKVKKQVRRSTAAAVKPQEKTVKPSHSKDPIVRIRHSFKPGKFDLNIDEKPGETAPKGPETSGEPSIEAAPGQETPTGK